VTELKAAMLPKKRGLSRVEAAYYVGVGENLFDAMVHDERLPKPARFNGRVVWDRFNLDKALDQLFGIAGVKEVVDPWVNGKA
jgi:hypothetical protein